MKSLPVNARGPIFAAMHAVRGDHALTADTQNMHDDDLRRARVILRALSGARAGRRRRIDG
jgi:hypothetical protein